jgi:hypothetical protein
MPALPPPMELEGQAQSRMRASQVRMTRGFSSSPLKKSRREAKRASTGLGTRQRDGGSGLLGPEHGSTSVRTP